MSLILIAAVARNGVIGADNTLPWRLPDDLKHFRALTLGHTVAMGRRTYESLPGPLQGRHCLVLTRDRALAPTADCTYVHSLDAILEKAEKEDVFVAGGANLYAQTLPLATQIHLTRVDADVPGDAYFPTLEEDRWVETSTEHHPADTRHPYAFTFRTLIRR